MSSNADRRELIESIRYTIDRHRYGNCTPDEYSVATPQNQAVWIYQDIIAAGYRKVPDDCVVVRRDDAELAADVLHDAMFGTSGGRGEDEAASNRIRQALADQST